MAAVGGVEVVAVIAGLIAGLSLRAVAATEAVSTVALAAAVAAVVSVIIEVIALLPRCLVDDPVTTGLELAEAIAAVPVDPVPIIAGLVELAEPVPAALDATA